MSLHEAGVDEAVDEAAGVAGLGDQQVAEILEREGLGLADDHQGVGYGDAA